MLDAGAAIDQERTLDVFSDEAWPEAVQIAEGTIAEWEAAGCIGLDHRHLQWHHDYLSLWIRDYGLPAFLGCDDPAPRYSETYLASVSPKRRAFLEQLKETECHSITASA